MSDRYCVLCLAPVELTREEQCCAACVAAGVAPRVGRPHCVYKDERAELWHADSLNAAHVAFIMSDRTADALIFDGPFSSETHAGHRAGKLTADRAATFAAAHANDPDPNRRACAEYNARKSEAGESGRRDLAYDAWSPEQVGIFCDVWQPKCSGWRVSLTDHVLAPEWGRRFELAGLYPFAPLPLVETGSRVRMSGDGPASWTCWIVVARPRSRAFSTWGAMRGAYVQAAERGDERHHANGDRVVGGKPLRAMIDIVGDYSRPDWLIVDPTAGGVTTGLAALRSGRRFLGIELDRTRAAIGADILRAEAKNTTRRAMARGQTSIL